MARRESRSTWLILVIFFIIVVQPLPELMGSPIQIKPNTRSGRTITVNISGNGDYTHVQWAIDNASERDVIHVDKGIYFENLIVKKSISLIGSGQGNTTINGNRNGDAIYIVADGVSVTGFNLTNNGTLSENSGVRIRNANDCLIKDNLCYRNLIGISMEQSKNNIITNNNCSENVDGIRLSSYSHDNTITNNVFNSNDANGIYLSGYEGPCNNNTITNNTFQGDELHNIYLRNSDHNKLKYNSCSINYSASIYLWSSDFNVITDNTCNSLGNWGGDIELEASNGNIIADNNCNHSMIRLTVSNGNELINNICDRGRIDLTSSHFNNITNNTCSYGIHLYNSNVNTLVYRFQNSIAILIYSKCH